MSWKEATPMSERLEFIKLATQEGANVSELCRRYGISRKTGYKFLHRYYQEGVQGLRDQSRRPKHSPRRTDKMIEGLILEQRAKHPTWGPRKLKRRLENMGHQGLPSASTIASILKRRDKILSQESEKRIPWKRFRAKRPNDLWQMDFKGHFPALDGPCHPLTILDDHSRFSLCIQACRDQTAQTVRTTLTGIFKTYGLPGAILVDNGSPWGDDADSIHTHLTVWLMQLCIRVIHSRPYHPQTLGKDERFHRTLNEEVIRPNRNKTIAEYQPLFDDWRVVYNHERPHQALDMDVPAAHYRMSHYSFPDPLPPIEYEQNDILRKVGDHGKISFHNIEYRVGKAFIGHYVAVRNTNKNNHFDVYFMHHKIKQIKVK